MSGERGAEKLISTGPQSWLTAKRYMPDANLFVDEQTALAVARQMEKRAYKRGASHAAFLVLWVWLCDAVVKALFA